MKRQDEQQSGVVGLAKETRTSSPLPLSALEQPIVETKDTLRAQMLRVEVAHALLTEPTTSGQVASEMKAQTGVSPFEARTPNGSKRRFRRAPGGALHEILGGGLQEVPSSASPSEGDASPCLSLSPRENYRMPRMKASFFFSRNKEENQEEIPHVRALFTQPLLTCATPGERPREARLRQRQQNPNKTFESLVLAARSLRASSAKSHSNRPSPNELN
ncbi:hypothetical protein Esti_001559 [Eimeria stiedai]